VLSEIRVPGLAPLHRDIALVRRRHAGALSPALAAFIETLRSRALARE
jgi:DNA-binding transcriptional LysR family regulator